MLLELTPDGVKTLEDIFAAREDWLTQVMLEKLTEDDRQDLERGLALIKKIIATRE